ncbi:nuclear transport factor 2 family protein [Maridesulfovibrio frigidus]|uniref:nuclear transport factor 2 family protein n=1 Tax=Maridesulfovibrio frigidus TaxID=340956 RepID=UPI0005536A5E|nr:nuclear transport factor 2 family protein [Maridesulfovibrio frigidus]
MSITKDEVRNLFSHLETGDADSFFNHVSPDVDWTVMGTHPLAGRYTSLEIFRQKTFNRLAPCLTAPIRLSLKTVFIDGNTAIVELIATSQALQGWDFDNKYCWIIEFEEKTIIRVRAYLDSNMVDRLIAEGEAASEYYYRG